MADFGERIIRAIKLDPTLYEEVEADEQALGQALLVVLFSSLAAGAGSATHNFMVVVVGAISSLAGWFIWAYLIHWIGTKLLPEPQTQSNPKELLRVLGFASAPGLLRVLGAFPFLRVLIFVITAIWMIAAMVIAIRQALDYTSTFRAVLVCVIAWFIQVVVWVFFLKLTGIREKSKTCIFHFSSNMAYLMRV